MNQAHCRFVKKLHSKIPVGLRCKRGIFWYIDANQWPMPHNLENLFQMHQWFFGFWCNMCNWVIDDLLLESWQIWRRLLCSSDGYTVSPSLFEPFFYFSNSFFLVCNILVFSKKTAYPLTNIQLLDICLICPSKLRSHSSTLT